MSRLQAGSGGEERWLTVARTQGGQNEQRSA